MSKPLALIVEDDPTLVDVFSNALQLAKYDTEIIRDGQTALERVRAVHPYLVVLDLHLPKISGQDLLEKIRQTPELSGTRIIIASADAVTAEILREQVDLVLIKPVSFHQLRELSMRLHPDFDTGALRNLE